MRLGCREDNLSFSSLTEAIKAALPSEKQNPNKKILENLHFNELPEIKNKTVFSNNIKKEVFDLKRIHSKRYRKEKRFNKRFLFFIAIALITLFSLFLFRTQLLELTGFSVRTTQSHTDIIEQNITESQDYEWSPENHGQLLNSKISGKLTLVRGGSVRIYLEDKLLLDSSELEKKNSENKTGPNQGNKNSLITGLAMGETNSTSEVTVEETPITEEVQPEENLSTTQISNLEEILLEENITEPSQQKNESSLPETQNETQNELNTNNTDNNITIPTENVTNMTAPEENITIPAENTTNISEEPISYEIDFSNICIETCDLEEFNLTNSSHTLRIELENASVFIDSITYGIKELKENLTNLTQENVTNITQENITQINITENFTENLTQYNATIGQPVKWSRMIFVENVSSEQPKQVKIKLPKESNNITLNKKENKKLKKDNFNLDSTGNETLININATTNEYQLDYETPAPQISEKEINKKQKEITVKGPDSVHYQNVSAFTNISEVSETDKGRIKLYWLVNDSKILIENLTYIDSDNDSLIDQVGWVVPHLSEQKFLLVIEITKAEHLDENYTFISDIYEQVKALDDIWSEEIPSDHYVQATFEKNLTNKNDITIFPRIISGNPRIEVYEINGTEIIAEFINIKENEYNKVFLTKLEGEQDTFDLKIVDGSVEFDHILDPAIWYSVNWAYRKQINVSNIYNNLTEYQVMLYIDTASMINDGKLNSNCSDLRFANSTASLISFYVDENPRYKCNSTETLIWLKTDTLTNNTNTSFYMYYGNPDETTSLSNITEVFTYSELKPIYYTVGENVYDGTIGVVAFDANTNVTSYGGSPKSVILQPGGTDTFTTAQYGGTGASYLSVTGALLGGDSLTSVGAEFNPISWASTEFIVPNSRGPYDIYFYSPFKAITINCYEATTAAGNWGSVQDSASCSAGGACAATTFAWTSGRSILCNSTAPFLMYVENGANSNFPIYPITDDLWIISDSEVGNGVVGAYVEEYRSGLVTITSGTRTIAWKKTDGTGSDGSGYAWHVNSSEVSLGGMETSDGDGTENAAYSPEYELEKEYYFYKTGEYIALAATRQATNCTLYAVGYSNLNDVGDETYDYPYPTKIDLGTGNDNDKFNSGSRVECNATAGGHWETADGDESTLFGRKAARQYVWPTPTYTISSEELASSVSWNTSILNLGIKLQKNGNLTGYANITSVSINQNVNIVCEGNDCGNFTDNWIDGTDMVDGQSEVVEFTCKNTTAGSFSVMYNLSSDNDTIINQINISCEITAQKTVLWNQSTLDITTEQGTSNTSNVTIIAVGAHDNVMIYELEGNGTDFMSAMPVDLGHMDVQEQREIRINCSPPLAQEPGLYEAVYHVNSTNDTNGNNITVTCDVSIVYGWLNVSLLTPLPSQITNVNQNQTFWVNATIDCIGGYCSMINGTARYNVSSSEYGTGTGKDGPLTITGDNTILNNYTYLTLDYTGGINLSVSDASEFNEGDEILIIQMQNYSGGIAGAYEFATIDSVDKINNNITLISALSNDFYTGTFNQVNATVTQIVRVPHYTTIDLDSGFITAPAWNGYYGGVVVFKSMSGVNFNGGTINVNEKGFRGGDCNGCGNNAWGDQGEGHLGLGLDCGVVDCGTGAGAIGLLANGQGGGGGYGPSGVNGEPGAGGGYGTIGGNGTSTYNSTGGSDIGIANLSLLFFGGGAGGGGDNDGGTPYPEYSDGGGMVIIFADSISNAAVYAKGETGTGPGGAGGVSGGGAGGTIWLSTTNLSISEVNASGGAGGVDSDDIGGDGGDGRIRLDFDELSGISDPESGYNGTLGGMRIISTIMGNTPFWTTNNQPQTCGILNATNNFCQLNWSVNATGNIGSLWNISVWFMSNETSIMFNDTNYAAINITTLEIQAPIASQGTNPVDNYNDTDGSITFDMKCSDNIAPSYLQLYGNWSGTWQVNQTNSSPYNDTWWNVTVTGIPEGNNYKWAVWCNDSTGTFDFTDTNRTFNVDTTAPTITLPVYVNATKYKNTQNMIFNISVTDSGSGPSYCRINVNGNANQTLAVSNGWCNGTYALTGLTDGNKTIYAYANDTLGNTGLNNSYVVWIDSTGPTITLPVYVNATKKKSTDTLTLNISVIDTGTPQSPCFISLNGGTNQTITYSNGWCNGTVSLAGLTDGNKTIRIYDNDSFGNMALNNSYVVWIDTTAPIASFGTNPIDNYNSTSGSVTFDMKCSDNAGVSTIQLWGNWSGTWQANYTNNSMASYNNTWLNITVTGIPQGNNSKWLVYCNDTVSSTNTTVNRTLNVNPSLNLNVKYVNLGKSSDSWFGEILINATVIDQNNQPVTGASVNVTVTPPAGRDVDAKTVEMKDDGVSPDLVANDGNYTVLYDISLNGSATTVGTMAVNVSAVKSGSIPAYNSSKSFTTFALRRWWGSAGVEDTYANYKIQNLGGGIWNINITDFKVYSPSTAVTNATVKIPIINQPSISGLYVQRGSNPGYHIENGNVIVLYMNFTSGGTTMANFSFNASSDLVLTHNDRYQTQTIGLREGKNGFTIFNSHMEQEVFGNSNSNSAEGGETTQGPYATGENVGGKVVDGESHDNKSHTDDCMERVGIPNNRSTGTKQFDICGSCNSYYEWNIHWTEPTWNNSYKYMGGEIVVANATNIILKMTDDPSTNNWGSTNYFNVTKILEYYSDKRYYRTNFTINNIDTQTINTTLVWGREPWTYSGGSTDQNDEGMLLGRYPLNVEEDYTFEELGSNWCGFYDNSTNYGTAIIFPTNTSEDVSTICAHLDTDHTPLGTSAGQNDWPFQTDHQTFSNNFADDIFAAWEIGNFAPGASRSIAFYHWFGYNNTAAGLEGEIITDALGIHNLNSGGTDTTPPIASFGTNPVDTYNDSDGSITFDMKCTDNTGVSYLQLWGNWSGSWQANYTNNSMFNYNNTWLNITVSGIPQGSNFKWAVWCNDTNNLENNTINRTFSVTTAVAPTIDDISNLPLQNVTEGGLMNVTFFVNVSDAQGFGTIDIVNATFIRTGEETRQNSSCKFISDYNATQANYSCTIGIWYWDGAGNWTINVTANDTTSLISSAYNETFELSKTTSFIVSPSPITFATIIPGTENTTSNNDPSLLNNTGNADIPLNYVSVKTLDLHGNDYPAYFINSTNFSISIETGSNLECDGDSMKNDTYVNITGSILTAGNNSLNYGNETSGQEQIYYCIKKIDTTLVAQTYSTDLLGSWLIKIIASMALIIPITKRKKKTKSKKKNSMGEEKVFTALESSLDEIKEKYSLSPEDIIDVIKIIQGKLEERTIPLNLFKEDLGALESLVKYLKENLNLPYHEIAKLLNRDDRTIWTTYRNTQKKKKEKLEIKSSKFLIPLSLFSNRKLSILESLVLYLKEKNLSFKEISELINRDQRNIWTINSRAKKKFKGL